MVVIFFALATPCQVFAGHGFFSSAPGGDAGRTQTETSAADGRVWAISAGALYSPSHDGRAWRLINPDTGGTELWLDPRDGDTMVAYHVNRFGLSSVAISRDSGLSWTRSELPNTAMESFFPTTGPWFGLFRDPLHDRVYRSVDEGQTWEPLEGSFIPLFIVAGQGGSPLIVSAVGARTYASWDGGENFQEILRGELPRLWRPIEISPNNSERLLIWGEDGEVYRSFDAGRTFAMSRLPGSPEIRSVTSTFHGRNNNFIVAEVYQEGEGRKFYRSTDGGASWSLSPAERFDLLPTLHPDPCDSRTFYLFSPWQDGLLRTTDSGASWQRFSPTPTPGQVRFLTMGSIGCELRASSSVGLLRSQDRGSTWELTGRGMQAGFSNGVIFDPNLANRAYAAGNGLARSEDGGRSWATLDNELKGLLVRQLLVHPDGSLLAVVYRIQEGVTDLFLSQDGGDTFSLIAPELGDWGLLGADPSNPSHLIAGFGFEAFESQDFGRTWQLLSEGSRVPDRAISIDPQNPLRMWGGTGTYLSRSEDGGRTWNSVFQIYADIATEVHPVTGEIWAVDYTHYSKSSDGGATWESSSPLLIGEQIKDLVFDRRDPATVYLTRTSGLGRPVVLRSTDSGETWHSWSEGFSSSFGGHLAQNPADPEHWLLAGSSGRHWRHEGEAVACPSYRAPGLCLRQDRFEVALDWQDFTGRKGSGQLVPLQTEESGLFTFFSPDNWEVMVKVLDGCGFNGHFWVFAAGTTNVDFEIRVTDRSTGRHRLYFNVLGENAPAVTDIEAFTCGQAGAGGSTIPGSLSPNPSRASSALPPSTVDTPWPLEMATSNSKNDAFCGTAEIPALCLGPDRRYRVTVDWRDFADRRGVGTPVSFAASDSGLFTFFGPNNWEVMVKVLDGCGFNDRIWVFGAATTNVEFELKVEDLVTGQVRSYTNPLGRSAEAIIDTDAFASCPSP